MKKIKELIKKYRIKKGRIKKRLKEFKKTLNLSNKKIFAELAFCICTPQTRATVCWNAISSLMKNGLLYKGNETKIRPFLSGVGFANKKTKRKA
jgi:N-glycosylase/DNA lyase